MSIVLNKYVKERHPHISKVDIFSDGPSSQFKNKYVAHFFRELNKMFPDMKWHYFATSHGKGAVDGIGGSVKRVVWKAVSTRKIVVNDAKSFAKAASELCQAVDVEFVGSESLSTTAQSLELTKCFQSAPVVPGIAKYHCLEPIQNGALRCRLFSRQSEWVDVASKNGSNAEEVEGESEVDDAQENDESSSQEESFADGSVDESEKGSEDGIESQSEDRSEERSEEGSEGGSEEGGSKDESEDGRKEGQNDTAEETNPREYLVVDKICVEKEKYYAVDYDTSYYIGRALSYQNDYVKFKFLHKIRGTDKFDWPGRDDINVVHESFVFYGPVLLQHSGPFVLPCLCKVEQVHAMLREKRKKQKKGGARVLSIEHLSSYFSKDMLNSYSIFTYYTNCCTFKNFNVLWKL